MKEEKELRNFFKGDPFHYCTKESNKRINALITALVRAVKEDCRKRTDEILAYSKVDASVRDEIAAAIRGRK